MGSPAYAGMDPSGGTRAEILMRLPRVRGDGPSSCRLRQKSAKAPPRTRGWTLRQELYTALEPGSPAYAGMDPWIASLCTAYHRLPRVRGDGPALVTLGTEIPMAPPRTRGWTRVRAFDRDGRRGSPAYAGMDPGRPLPRR